MTNSPELFRAILSLDAYNRGYNTGFSSLGVGSLIGDAQIIMQSDTLPGTPGVAAGFYAIAYQVGGQTIISYRGTDNPGSLPNARDVFNAYGVAMGGVLA